MIGLDTDIERAQVIVADGSHLAYVEHSPVEANARLIAAAPELLGALAGLYQLVIAVCPTPDARTAALRQAQDALAKATGQ